MPSNQTPNYQLNQWERSDKVQMEDFNADNAKIDAALKAEADARTAAEELAKATRSEVVQVIGTKFVLYRETHSKPKEKRIQLVKERKKKL